MLIKALIFDWDETLYDTHATVSPEPSLFAETEVAIKSLANRYKLFLVTLGEPKIQEQKISKTQLGKYFEQVKIVDKNQIKSKQVAFEGILNDLKAKWVITSPREVVSIGNRIDTDIRPAQKLKMRGVHFEFGDYAQLQPETPYDIPEAKVRSLSELQIWLNQNE